MRKKSNKSSMRKLISNILACFLITSLIAGCGIKGPLTQKKVEIEQEQPKENNLKQSEENNTKQEK